MSRREAFAAALVFLLVGSFRFLALTGFPDDHFVHLAGAQQMLFGAWPSRDFVDLGAPFTYAASAAAQAMFGHGVYVEAVFMAVVFAAAAVVTLRVAILLTGSILLGLAAVALEVLIFPRTYSYPKMLVYSVAPLLLARYAQRPSPARLAVLAVASVTALLIRHDHGLYVGMACLTAALVAPVPGRSAVWTAGRFITSVVLLATPYLIYLQATGGVVEHLARGVGFASLEMPRQRLDLSREKATSIWLLALMWTTPVTAAILATTRRRAGRAGLWPGWTAVLPIAVLALVADYGMIRDSLPVRLPDVVVPPALLMAWLVRQAWAPAPPVASIALRSGSVTLLALSLAAASVMGATHEQLDRMGLFNRPERVLERFGERTRELRRPWAGRQTPSLAATQMAPFFDYVARCVDGNDRLLVPNFLPEIPVLAGRAFAGGQMWFMAGTVNSADDHERVMRRLAGERVPLAIVRRPNYTDLAREFPELDAYVSHFTPVAQWSLGGSDTLTLSGDPRLARGTDAETGWPCFR